MFFTNRKKCFLSENICLKCFGFQGKPGKNKKRRVYLYAFLVILLKLLIAN